MVPESLLLYLIAFSIAELRRDQSRETDSSGRAIDQHAVTF